MKDKVKQKLMQVGFKHPVFMLVAELPKQGKHDVVYVTINTIYGGYFCDNEVEVIERYFEEHIWLDGKWVLIDAIPFNCEKNAITLDEVIET